MHMHAYECMCDIDYVYVFQVAMVTCTDVVFVCAPKGDTGAYELLAVPAQRNMVH